MPGPPHSSIERPLRLSGVPVRRRPQHLQPRPRLRPTTCSPAPERNSFNGADQEVAAQTVIALEMADDGFDCRSSPPFSFERQRDAAPLLGDEDAHVESRKATPMPWPTFASAQPA
jgi:hypothetical protein